MEIHAFHASRAQLVAATLAAALIPQTTPAGTLLSYDFDGMLGAFETTPEVIDASLSLAQWSDPLATLTDFSGNPGRAIAISQFTNGNLLVLEVEVQSGYAVDLTDFNFDQRASDTGPAIWELAIDGQLLASATTTSEFTHVAQALDLRGLSGRFTLTVGGSVAGSAAGTLRLDNVELLGTSVSVALPPTFYLIASPLLGLTLRRVRVQFERLNRRRAAPAARHSASA